MLKLLLKKYIKKHGLRAILIKVGDIAVKITKSKNDDKVWVKIRKLIESL